MIDSPVRVLLIEDNPGDARLVKDALSEPGIGPAVSLAHSERLSQGLEHLDLEPVDAILLDLTLPDSSGLATFQQVYARARHVPIILLTGMDDEVLAQDVMRAGAQDYLVKGQADARTLMRSIRYAIERKLSEDNLRGSEERYRTLIEQASDGIFITDPQRNLLDVNSSGCALLGYSRAELLSMNLRNLSARAAAPRAEVIFDDLASGQVVIFEYELIHKDGSRVPVEISAKMLTDGRLQAFVRDIRARKQAEAALRESNEFNQMLVKTLPFWMDIIDDDGHVLYMDPGMQAALGQQVLGQRCWEVYKDDRKQCLDCPLKKSVELGVTKSMQTAGVLGGRVFEITHTGMLYRGHTALLEIFQDVTERERAEQALRASEAFGQAILNSSPIGISVRGPTGRLLTANDAWKTIWAIPDSDVQKDSSVERTGLAFDWRDDYLKSFQDDLRAVYERGGNLHLPELKTSHPRPGGAEWVSQHFYAILDENGKVSKVVILTEDITERKKAELALLQAHAELEQRVIDRTIELQTANLELEKAAHMKDEFLASMSHELRTPLTGILGLSEALQMVTYGELNEKQLKALKNIETSGRHLLSLINDILDLSKIEAGMLEMQFAPTSLDGICQVSLQLVKGMAGQKHQNVSFTINPASIALRADPRRLKQMLVNLLGNAVKFTPDGGSLGIDVKGLAGSKQVSITVWDTGIGIQPEDLPRLFQPFVQLDGSLSRQYTGTGLGLSLVKRMAEMQGGQILVESTFGAGSRFTIILPWVVDATLPLQYARRVTDRLQRALTIDHEEENAARLTALLQLIGLKNGIMLATIGAFELAAETWPDVIIIREHLPDRAELDLLVELKADPRTHAIPLILISRAENRELVSQLGADGLLMEPFAQAELHAELQRVAFGSQHTESDGRHGLPVKRRVLLADDNQVIVDLVSDFLKSRNFQVSAVYSGSELLERLNEFQPDVLLIDIQMPGMNGFEVIKAIRAHASRRVANLPVIAVTALAMSGDRERCLAAGANEYMSKPLELQELLEAIRALCR
jgi:PAS domain S-box-containing protein